MFARIIIPRDSFVDVEHIRTTIESNSNVKEEGGTIYSYLTREEYQSQMLDADSLWKCPRTRIIGIFDDTYFEEKHY